MIPGELVVDNFAGAGGASTGIERALGRPIDIAVNHDADAIRMHEVNHPLTKHLCENVWKVNPMIECAGRPVGLAWFSPDCFPAGTLVLTRRGYQAIEEIEVNDEVLTHKLRWKKVIEVSSTRRPLMSIKGHGHPGLLVSPEHPFYARRRKDVWRTDPRGYERTLEPVDWAPASVLTKGWYWAAPTIFPQSEIPPVQGRGMAADHRLMWLVGRYLGDGWTRLTETRAELVITCGKHEVDALRELLSVWVRQESRAGFNELAWHERATGTAYQFATNHRGLVGWLREHFGHRAEAKRVPAWVLGLNAELRQALLDGYLSADGWAEGSFSECRTVSKALAFGVKGLLNSLGKTVIVHQVQNSEIIQGRHINARPIFMLRWRNEVDHAHAQTFIEDGLEWCPIRSQEPAVIEADVFNIGVDEDESYIVEGIVVHNCKHFSKAKGTKPVSKKIRGLAWVVMRWAATVKPRIIMLENVEEFMTWGPLLALPDGTSRPCPKRKGRTFKSFLNELRKAGYEVDHRLLRACDYGDPTIRRRLFLIARCDGQPIVWPAPTHGDPKSEAVKSGRLKPWRTAAECIQWEIPAPSIFERKKALAEATQRRIFKGISRYVVDAADPFIVTYYGDKGVAGEFRGQSVDEPLRTQTTENRHGIVVPFMARTDMHKSHARCAYDISDPLRTITSAGGHALASAHIIPLTHQGGDRTNDLRDPFPTVTGAHRGEIALVSPTLIQTGYGEREGQEPRVPGLGKPLGTVVAGGIKHALVAATIAKNNHGDKPCQSVDEPLHTITTQTNKHALVAAFLAQQNGGFYDGDGRRVDAPLSTITQRGTQQQIVAASIVRNMGASVGYPASEPVRTVMQQEKDGLVTSHLIKYKGSNVGQDVRQPLQTITAGGYHFGEVRAFLMKYYGTDQDPKLAEPLHTVTTKDRFGLVEVKGEDYEIVDIGLRMLMPRELFRAQGFYDTYIIDRDKHGRPFTKTAQVKMCGNSVCPGMAAALVAANVRSGREVGIA